MYVYSVKTNEIFLQMSECADSNEIKEHTVLTV